MLFSTGYAKYVDAGTGGYAFIRDVLTYGRQPVHYDVADKAALDEKMRSAVKKQTRLSPSVFSSDWLSGAGNNDAGDEYFAKIAPLVRLSERQKEKINSAYGSMFAKDYCLPDEYNHWRFNILVNEPEKLLKEIFTAGLFAGRHYCPIDRYILTPDARFPAAERLYRHVINLFNDRYFSVNQAEMTGAIVKKHIARYGYPEK
jgi:hypothetical protein